MPREFLSLSQAAKMIGLTRRGIGRWIAMGRLRPMRRGGKSCFERRDLLRQFDDFERGVSAPRDFALG